MRAHSLLDAASQYHPGGHISHPRKGFSLHTLEQLRSGALAGTRRLDLSAHLQTLPPEVFDLADTLEVLNLSGNQLSSLPLQMHSQQQWPLCTGTICKWTAC